MISEATRLRERAMRCREIAKEYSALVAAPLHESAAAFEREAARLERQGVERREGALFG